MIADVVAADRALLGLCLVTGAPADVDRAGEFVAGPDDFTHPAHREIWRVLTVLAGQSAPTDAVTVRPQIRDANARMPDDYLLTLVHNAPAGDVAYHARRLAELVLRVRAREALTSALQDIDEGKDIARALAKVDSLSAPERADTSTPHLPGLPAYPRGELVGPLADLVATGAATGLPAPYLGGAGLATLATVAGGARLRISNTWMVRPVLWVPLIGPAGSAKTPTLDAVRGRLRELDSATTADYIAAWENWQATPPKDRDEPPQDDRLLIDDATLEAVAIRLAAGTGTGGTDTDEMAEFLSGMSRYRSGGSSDRTRWLSLWSSSPWTVDRAGGRKLHIPCPVVTVCGGLQPHLVNLLGPEGDGMRPRWLPHPSPDLDLTWRPGQIAGSWSDTIEVLYGHREEREWTLSDAALKAWKAARDEWKAQTRGIETPSTIAALAKADTQAARIALVLAESRHPGQLDGVTEIDEDTMASAITIARYVLDVWRAMPEHGTMALSRRDELLDTGVDELAEWLDRRGGQAARAEIQRAKVARARTAAELDALLSRYEAVYPGSVRKERTGARGPKTVVVHAPRRGNAPSPTPLESSAPETLDVYSFESSDPAGADKKRAGQRSTQEAGETLDAAKSFPANSFPSTVSATQRDQRSKLAIVESNDGLGEWSA